MTAPAAVQPYICPDIAAYRARVLAEAIDAARRVFLGGDVRTPEDDAYNRGVSDVVAALEELRRTS